MPLFHLASLLSPLCPRCPCSTRLLSSTLSLRARQSNYYELLGIRPDASMKEVKRAFFAKSKVLHPDRDPKNPALHNQFVELNEAYRVLSKESSRRHYDSQLYMQGSMPPPSHTSQSYRPASASASASSSTSSSSSWASSNARYWAQFHRVRPEDYRGDWQKQQKHNQRVMGYCLLLMLGGMVVHYIAFRILEQVHRRFMDEKDRVIMAIYNESRSRARAKSARQKQERQQDSQDPQPEPGK